MSDSKSSIAFHNGRNGIPASLAIAFDTVMALHLKQHDHARDQYNLFKCNFEQAKPDILAEIANVDLQDADEGDLRHFVRCIVARGNSSCYDGSLSDTVATHLTNMLQQLTPKDASGPLSYLINDAFSGYCDEAFSAKWHQINQHGGAKKQGAKHNKNKRRATKWAPTGHKVVVRGKGGVAGAKKTVYRNTATGELRVRKMVANKADGGGQHATYVKF